MKGWKAGVTALSIVALLMVGLAGCAKRTPTPAPAPAAATPAPTPKAVTPVPSPPATPAPAVAATPPPIPRAATPTPTPEVRKPKGELRVGLATFSRERLDPIQEDRMGGWTFQGLVYDPLIAGSPDGSLAPGIAEKWEMTPDGRAWVFHIRRGVQFHDGWGEVTAEDVKFSLERFMSPESTSSFVGMLRTNVKSIEVLDRYTVKVNTPGVLPFFPYQVSMLEGGEAIVMSKKYIEEKGAAAMGRTMVGTGPWKFIRHVPGDRMEFEAIEDPAFYSSHFRQMPRFKRLTLYLVPDESTRLAMLRKEELDLIEISAERVAEAKAAGLEVRQIPYGFQVGVQISGTWRSEVADNPLAKVEVRKALSLAINRDEVIQRFFMGIAEPTLPWLVAPYGADVDAAYWRKYSEEAFRYDLEEAKRLLARAGYPQGFTVRMPAFTMPARGYLPKLAEVFASYWEKIGVKVKFEPMDFAPWIALVRKQPQPPEIIGTLNAFGAPTRYVMGPSMPSYFHHAPGPFQLMNDPEAEKLMADYQAEMDNAKRAELGRKLIHRTAESYTFLPVAFPGVLYATGGKVGKWQPIDGHPYLALIYETIRHPGE